MAGKKKQKKRAPTTETYESRTLTFDQVLFWDDLKDVARQIYVDASFKDIPDDAIIDMRGDKITVTGSW